MMTTSTLTPRAESIGLGCRLRRKMRRFEMPEQVGHDGRCMVGNDGKDQHKKTAVRTPGGGKCVST